MPDITLPFIKKSNLKNLIFSLIVFFGTINSSLFAQATCTLPVTGPFFENNGGGILSIGQMKTQGLCYTMPAGAVGTFKTVCYRYTYPLSGTIAMNYGIEYSCGSSCSAGYQTSYNGACLGSPDCNVGGAGPVITTYDASCGFVMNGGGIGTGCGAGAFVPGQDYIMCFKVPLDPSCTVTVCPVIACSSGNCGCPSSITATVSANQILCGVTTTTITGNNAAPGTGTWTRISGPNTPSITSPNSASTTVTGMITGTYVFRWSVSCASANGTADITVTVNPNLVPAISSNTPVTCTGSANGILTVTSTGGAAPYTYAWTPSGGTGSTASNLSGGTYTVTVVGGGCTKTVSATVAQSGTLLTPTISSITPVGCTGGSTGSLTASQTGGTGSFTYLWSPGGATTSTISGLSANTYTVTITDAYGCIKTTSGIVTQPVSAIGSTISSQNNVNCKGDATGSATVTGTGGTPNYTYSWSPGSKTTAAVTGLTSGTYSVTVTDANGCTQTQSVTITQPTFSLGSNISSQNNVNCKGDATGSATVTGTGGTPNYTYSWSPGSQTTAAVTGLTSGTYSVTVTDANGCTQTQSVTITQPTFSLGSNISSQNNVNCKGDATGSATVTGTGGTPNYTYSWSPGSQTTAAVTGLTSGTYSVTVTDANGCTKVQSVTITQPIFSLGSNISSQNNVNCKGDATGSATVTGTGGTPNYTYSWSPGSQTTAAVTGLTSGTYSVTVMDNKGCTKVQSVSITQPASSVISTTGSTNATCGNSNGTASVTAIGGTPGFTYSWSPVGGTGSTATNLPAGPYNITITDSKGCSKVSTISVNNSGAPTIGISSQTDVLCNGSGTGTATVTATGGTGLLSYLWSPDGQTATTISNLIAGTYVCTVTDVNNCAQGQTVTIIQPATAINSGISSQINVGCTSSATGSATITATGGTGILIYSWSPGSQSTPAVTGLTSGTYSVTITDANGCSVTQTVVITEPASVVGLIIDGQSNVNCNGSATGSATVTGTGGTPNYTYSWSPGSKTTAAVTGLTAGNYNVTVTDANGCTTTQTVDITQPASVIGSTITAQSNVNCIDNATGNATVTGTGGTPNYTYSWNPGGQTTTSVTGLTAGNYNVTVTDANGCTTVQSVAITQPTTAVNIGISSQSNVGCTGFSSGSATITATGGTGTLTYLWSPGGQTTNTISGLPKGTYSVTVTDANGCSQQQIVNITQPTTSLSITPGSTNASCGSSDGTVSVTASGGTPLYTYNWNNGATDALISGLIAGTYSVIVTDNNGCSQTTSVTISGLPGPSITGTPSSNITCNGLTNGTITVNASSGTLPYTYIWTPSVTTNNVANNLSATTYTVVVSDAAGCKDTAVILIKEPLAMTFSLTTSNATVCAGEPLTLLTSTPVGGTAPFTFTWLPTGPLVNPLIPTTYSVTVTDAGGCVSPMDTIRVIPLAKPTAGFDAIPSGLLNDKYTFKDSSIGADSWYWNFGDGTTSTGKNPYHTYLGAGTYTVTQVVINSVTGCTDTITKIIVILPKIIIPNVFTPNHDGINDDFWIPNTGFESFELTIYDRWGLKLFTTNEGQIRWDGRTSAGNEVPDGTYYFILTAILNDQDGEKKYDAKGFINMVRGGEK